MVQTYGEFLYKELKIRGLTESFSTKNSPIDNIKILNDILVDMNVTKNTICGVEMEHPGSILYLQYLLQLNHGINFGICEFFKVWKNREGWQYRCRLDKGKNRRIQVRCQGSLSRCEKKKEYNYFRERFCQNGR